MRIAILGNAGSGTSSRARVIGQAESVPLLDLDTVASKPGRMPCVVPLAMPRRPCASSARRATGGWSRGVVPN